jgi:hypothetical protein
MVGLLGSALATYVILSFHCACGHVQGLRGAYSAPRGTNLPKDAARGESNRAHNEKMWAWKERKQSQSVSRGAVKEWVQDSPTESGSLDEEEEEGEGTPPPLSPLHVTLHPLSGITDHQAAITDSWRRPKQNQTGTGSLAGSPQQPCLMSVTSCKKRISIPPVLTQLTYLSGIL